MKSVRTNFLDATTLAVWASPRDRVELSALFMAAMASGDAVLSARGIHFAGSLPFVLLNGAAFTALWVSFQIGLRTLPRLMILFTLWSLAETVVTDQVTGWMNFHLVQEVSSR